MKDIPLWLKYLVSVSSLFVAAWAIYTYLYPLSYITFNTAQLSASVDDSIGTSTINISNILSQLDSMDTSLEQENFLVNYENAQVYGIGSFNNIAKPSDTYLVTIDVSGGEVSCNFSVSFGKNLLLLKKGVNISFTGIFTGNTVFGGGWDVEDCNLIN
jgi:hypothetical protein